MSTTSLRGRRFVLGLYLAIVAFAGCTGVLFARVVEEPAPPSFLFLVELPPTQLGFAIYGALTVATVLGVPLVLVTLVARVDDDAVARSDE